MRNYSNKIILTQEVRLDLTEEQKEMVEKCFNVSRFVYNKCLEHAINLFKIDFTKKPTYADKYNINYSIYRNFLKDYIRPNYKSIISEVPAILLNPIIIEFTTALKKYKFEKNIKMKFRLKDKHKSCSFERKDYKTFKYKIINGSPYVFITRLGYCKMFNNLRWKAKYKFDTIRKVSIKKIGDRYYAYIVCELEKNQIKQLNSTRKTIALDWGIKDYFTGIDSDGKIIKINLDYDILENKSNKIKKVQSKMSRNFNQHKIKRKYSKLVKSKKEFMKNSIHIIANKLLNEYDTIILENINIRTSRKFDSHYNSKIQERPFYMFKEILLNKCSNQKNKRILFTPELYPSTQMCSCCGHVRIKGDKLTLNDRVYKCKECGFEEDRDINAAKNIFNCKELEEF